MAFFINRQPAWLVKALNRSPADDSGVPNFIPDTIAPSVDVFGWEALQRMRSASSTAAVGIEQVFPTLSEDWVSVLGGNPQVPPDVSLRIIISMHIQHNLVAASLIMWFGVLDREGGSTGIATETGTGTTIPQSTPLCIRRPVFLRPTESIIGRVRGLNPAATLNIFYTWIDLQEGEYIAGLQL